MNKHLNNLKILKYNTAILLVLSFSFFALGQEKMVVKGSDYVPGRITYYLQYNNINNSGYSVSGNNVVTQYPNIRVFSSPYNQS